MSDCAAQVDAWIEPLGDSPCGEDLEYDNEFLELTKAAAGRPETQFAAAEPPNWAVVDDLAKSLFNRTRDIRVGLVWGRAQLHREGLLALPEVLRLLRELMGRYWDDVHPKPDPDDGDAYARLNTLGQLDDASTMLGDIRQAVVFRSRAVGQLTVRDLELALELLPAREDESPMTPSGLSEMLGHAASDIPGLRELPERLGDELERLLDMLNERAGYGRAPDCEVLKAIIAGLKRVMPADGEAAGSLDDLLNSLGGGDADGHQEAPVARSARGGAGIGDSIDTKADAVKAIELVCAFLERTEPSNPAQLFLRRAQKLIDKNFLELVKELAPEALNEVAKIMGVDPNTVEGGSDGY
jgi:type VI secretion system protein ImpA